MTLIRTHTWFWLSSGSRDAAYNMGMDEALLEGSAHFGAPVLRFYAWTQPAASFGYFQKHADVERATELRPLVRRPTAGGIVPHDADWTYSLTAPPGTEWYELRAADSYARMHRWIRAAFASLGIESTLAERPSGSSIGQCFVGYEQHDLLSRGGKVAGAAQRRNRAGLLIQGSVQFPSFPVERAQWEQAMLKVAAASDCVYWEEFTPREQVLARATELAAVKYSRPEWNERR